MRRAASLSVLLALLATSPVAAQRAADTAGDEDGPGPLRTTVTAGFGNALGWLGAQGAFYFAGDRLSAFGGLGYTPEIESGDPTGATVAAGLRGYTPGDNHRGFLELSVSQVVLDTRRVETDFGNVGLGGERRYGPGLQAGYQYTADGGFTVMASGGVGYAVGLDADHPYSPVQPLIGLGLGYTWR